MRIIPWTPKNRLHITPQKIALQYNNFKCEEVDVNEILYPSQTSQFTVHNTFIDQNRFSTV